MWSRKPTTATPTFMFRRFWTLHDIIIIYLSVFMFGDSALKAGLLALPAAGQKQQAFYRPDAKPESAVHVTVVLQYGYMAQRQAPDNLGRPYNQQSSRRNTSLSRWHHCIPLYLCHLSTVISQPGAT